MLKKIFYILKPIIPRSFQLYLRKERILVKLLRHRYKNIWPILEGSEKKPNNWQGWPDGKRFALVLTHDVEHKKGYDRVVDLMNLEKELGFVSSVRLIILFQQDNLSQG